MATIKDVAKKAGVSISTASYALNNIPNVHPITKKKILDAAKELQYIPQFSARHLKTNKTNNIGVFIYGFSGPVFSDILEGIRQTLQANKRNIIVSSGLSSHSLLLEKQVDGAIIFDANITNEMIEQVASKGMPIIVLDRDYISDNVYQHSIDNGHLVETFMEAIITSKKYHSYGFISGPMDSFNAVKRFEGFKKALKNHGVSEYTMYHGDFTIDGGFKIGQQFKYEQNKPEFILCANDETAIGFMQAIKEHQFKIPHDVAIAGFDNFYMTQFTQPKITTIGINHIAWGQQVAAKIIQLLNGQLLTKKESPKGEFFWRETCR
jgi:LacI family transcriptional regulator